MRAPKVAALIVGLALGFGLMTREVRASASGYICNTVFDPQLPGWGNYGYAYATFYSEPNCGGSYLESSWYCTVGATNPTCNSFKLYTDAGIQGLVQNLARAAAADQRVYNWTDGSGKAAFVYFYSN